MVNHRNISIIWDFDGTLTPADSTSAILEYFKIEKNKFWKWIHEINGSRSKMTWERMLSADAPAWMYILSRVAFNANTPLTPAFFKKIVHLVKLYPYVERCLSRIKKFEQDKSFKNSKIKIHHFIITAGLKEYVDLLISKKLISNIWGGRYTPIYASGHQNAVESLPVFCMDETMKTRALYEISKGVFTNKSSIKFVNQKVETEKLWCPFENMIYIGDGPTDIPALSLTRSYGGYGIVVFNPQKSEKDVKKKLKDMSAESRCDLITSANFSIRSDLFLSIKTRCYQILQKYEAKDFSKK